MKSSKTIILMAVAVGCGLVASFLTSRLLADRGGPAGPEMVKRLVAKKNIAIGTVIKEPEKYFVEKEFSIDSAPKKGYESFDAIKNQKLTKPISEDAPITKDDILEGSGGSFAQAIPPGHQALSIKVNPECIVTGFLQAMDRVDVIWTLNKGELSQTQTLLQNMLVLATDQDAARADQQAKLATTATLAVTPEDAQKLALAAQNGELRLSLLKYGYEERAATRPLLLADLIRKGGQQEQANTEDTEPVKSSKETTKPVVETTPATTPTVAPKESDEPPPFQQEIINGSSRIVVTHRFGGKDDGTVKVEKSDPTVTPKEPAKQPEPPKPSDSKPAGETAPVKGTSK